MLPAWASLPVQMDRLGANAPESLLALILASAGLAVLALILALIAVGKRLWWTSQARHRAARVEMWRAHLLEVLAGERPPHSLASQIDVAHRDAFLRFLLPYATAVRGRASERISALSHPFISGLRRELGDRRPSVRTRAVQWIGVFGGPDQAGSLRRALGDSSDRVAEVAFRHLARLGGPGDTERLLSCLGRLTHVDRRQVSSALAKLGEGAAPRLRAAVAASNRSQFVRVCCAETLRWLGDADAAPLAARLLREMSVDLEAAPAEVAASLLRLLRAVGRKEHRSVARRFCWSPVPFVRIHAARALGQLGTGADEELLNALVSEDSSRWVALGAARSLVELKQVASLRALKDSDHRRSRLASDVLPTSQPTPQT
ncbi:HEAT repeat protein [Salinibacter ruber]|jgi:HEAT repeat protein|nr:HEAT repeat protein [Salinibacter ruber]